LHLLSTFSSTCVSVCMCESMCVYVCVCVCVLCIWETEGKKKKIDSINN
jgi:hypothetical protein